MRDRADNKATRGVFILSSGPNDEFSCSLIFHSELMMPLNCNLVISRPLSRLSLIFSFYNSCRQFCWLRPLLGCDCVSHNSISVLLNVVCSCTLIRHDRRLFLHGSTLFTIILTSALVEMKTSTLVHLI